MEGCSVAGQAPLVRLNGGLAGVIVERLRRRQVARESGAAQLWRSLLSGTNHNDGPLRQPEYPHVESGARREVYIESDS